MTNKTIETMLSHRSIRSFKDLPIQEEDLDQIIKAAHRAPSSINGQALSIIVIRESSKRTKIAELTGGQPWIAQAPVFLVFVLDFYKTMLACERAGSHQIIHETAEGIIAGSIDIGIALGSAICAAESLGFGIVPIGGVRKSPQDMIDLLELPAKTFPLVGLAIGYPKDVPQQKPRIGLNAFRHDEAYKARNLPQLIDDYDQVMERYLTDINRSEIEVNWTYRVASFYSIVYYPEVAPTLQRQGFSFER